jgi:putative oxidoreductase
MEHLLPPTQLLVARLAITAFFSILFVQSGLDKVINFRENLSWLVGHFSKTFMSGIVPVVFILVTCSEVLAGAFSVYGIVQILFLGNTHFALIGAYFSILSLLFLFFGQRIAKDYNGAGTIVTYFLAAIAYLFLLS